MLAHENNILYYTYIINLVISIFLPLLVLIVMFLPASVANETKTKSKTSIMSNTSVRARLFNSSINSLGGP